MIKTLAKSIREYKFQSIITPILVLGEVAMEVIIPLLMASLIDNGISDGSMGYVVRMGVILLICAVVSMFFGSMAGKTCAAASAGFAKNLRHDMYYNVQNFAFSNIDKFSTASIVTRLTTDVTNVQQAYMMLIRTAVRSPLMLVFSFVFSFRINARLSTVFIVFIPILAAGLLLIISKAHPLFKRVFNTYDRLNASTEENLRGIRVVKSFNREEYEKSKFYKISENIYSDFVKAEKLVALNMPLMQVCMYSCVIIISWFGAKIIVNSTGTELSTGELTSMFTYAVQILSSLMMLSMLLVMFTMSRASGERITEILKEKSDITNCENPVEEVKDGSIELDNVGFKYSKSGEKYVLQNINLKINSGETIGIIGGTGSAKSTLVQLIPRLYDVTEGSVKVGGTDVRDYDLNALRNNVAMVLQKNELFSGTIKSNLLWGNENATDEEITDACRKAQAEEFIENLPDKYDTVIEQGGTNVSGGQKQRLCIARALLKRPKILILDDSTSAVDTATDSKIRKALRDDLPETTKIIIAQRISSVQEADKIIVMDDGKIAAFGNHEQLMNESPIYREVYDSQVKGGDDDE
ncbi:MAG: ABC transporter ATP-binding protein/permease [Clostridiales bacterium]|nr:ABC transporter ATP-binding protein/permease [Clostridiales bacterium]